MPVEKNNIRPLTRQRVLVPALLLQQFQADVRAVSQVKLVSVIVKDVNTADVVVNTHDRDEDVLHVLPVIELFIRRRAVIFLQDLRKLRVDRKLGVELDRRFQLVVDGRRKLQQILLHILRDPVLDILLGHAIGDHAHRHQRQRNERDHHQQQLLLQRKTDFTLLSFQHGSFPPA